MREENSVKAPDAVQEAASLYEAIESTVELIESITGSSFELNEVLEIFSATDCGHGPEFVVLKRSSEKGVPVLLMVEPPGREGPGTCVQSFSAWPENRAALRRLAARLSEAAERIEE